MTEPPSSLRMLLYRHTKRREFITLLGGAAGTQQPAMPVLGFLNATSLDGYRPMVAAFHRGLNETGYVEGQNVMVEYHWLEGQYDRATPSHAPDLGASA
jgi:putative tryptophan/tyrosine transport system substrate-binding protein